MRSYGSWRAALEVSSDQPLPQGLRCVPCSQTCMLGAHTPLKSLKAIGVVLVHFFEVLAPGVCVMM